MRFLYGLFIGVLQGTGEAVIGTNEGVIRTRTVKRLIRSSRWDTEAVLSVIGTPWAPDGGGDDKPIAIRIPRPAEDEGIPAEAVGVPVDVQAAAALDWAPAPGGGATSHATAAADGRGR